MIRAFFSRWLDTFEREFNYDATYMRELLDSGGVATFFKFSLLPSLGHGKRAPKDAMAAVGILGTLSEDCGPCTQLGIDLATKSGVQPEVLRAILAGDTAAMGADAALAYDFAQAVLERDMERADPLRDEIVRRWGKAALVDLSLALTTSRMYPTLKYGLGYGKTCSKVVVDGRPAAFHRPEALAA
jgi:hypothetical protein